MKTIEFEVPGQPSSRFVLRPPSRGIAERAEQVYQRAVRRAVSRGRTTAERTAALIAIEWDDAKQARHAELKRAIAADEAIVSNGSLDQDERSFAAFRLRRLRDEVRGLRAGVDAIEANAAEAAGLQAQLDFFVATSTYDSRGRRVFESASYLAKARDGGNPVALKASWAAAEALLGLREDFETARPEDLFLAQLPADAA